jgi:hypothetical protein
MEFITKEITIGELIELYEKDKLFLNPPYQRNEIWSMPAKKLLIDSIIKKFALPNFFLLETDSGRYEVVDGQQRIRTIINFYKGLFPNNKKDFYSPSVFPDFIKYKLVLVILRKSENQEAIEDFYTRVNSTGMKLNKPELRKAEYYNTRFLNLVESLAAIDNFQKLDLFSDKSLTRMNDVDFVSELVSLIKNGITDKKDAVDKMFQEDVTEEEYNNLFNAFMFIINIVETFNNVYSINQTRYKQRSDFYTLFGFLNNCKEVNRESLIYFYKILVLIDEDIKPSNEDCPPFFNYALNCVSQSNSKIAREERLQFFNELFLNNSAVANNTQKDILNFYNITEEHMIQINGYYTISGESVQSVVKEPIVF